MNILKYISILLLVIVKMININCSIIYKKKITRDILEDTFRQWNFPIQYKIESPLQDNVIKEALDEISNNTCVTFQENTTLTNDTQGIVFEKSNICASEIGLVYSDKLQIIRLTDECSKVKGLILHEVGHSLGLVHEHCRTDRDNYVKIHLENLKDKNDINYKIQNHPDYKNYSTYYDFSSIMHYGQYDSTHSYWYPILESKLDRAYNKMMGQRSYMTFNDYKKINLAHCKKHNITPKKLNKRKRKGKSKSKRKSGRRSEKSKNENKCRNGGYPHYKNRSECICPFGYTGPICRDIFESDGNCGNTNFSVTENISFHSFLGKKKCFVFLRVTKEKKINVGIYYLYARSSKICTEDVSHQVKYFKDKGTTGLLLCSWYRDIVNVTSDSNSVLIFYNGQDSNHFMHFGFRQVD